MTLRQCSVISGKPIRRSVASFGTPEDALRAQGDIENCDGDVDLRDLVTLLANFGETYP